MRTVKQDLVAGLITKICLEKKMPEIGYDIDFLTEADWKLIEFLRSRKNELPSIEYLERTFKFKRHETELTVTDSIALLDKLFTKESIAKLFDTVRDTYQKDGDKVSEKDILDQMKAAIFSTRSTISQTNVTSMTDVSHIVDKYQEWTKLSDPVATGFERIDSEAPFRRGELVCLIGGTGGGKSLTTQFMFANNILNKVPATLISLEMDEVQVLGRILPVLTKGRIKSSDIRFGKLAPAKLKEELEKYTGDFNIVTRKTSQPIRISTIEAHLEEQKAKGKRVDVLYVDYLGLLDQPLDWNAEEKVSAQLKRLAIQYNCLVIILVQADTATLNSKAMPTITSIADNKGIARDCDIVFALKSERNNDKDNTLTIEYDFLKRRSDGNYISMSMKVNAESGIWSDCFVARAN